MKNYIFKTEKVFVFIIIILGLNFLLYKYVLDHRYKAIILHHSASPVDNYASIKDYHQKKHHWRDAGYHLILSNESTDVPLGYLEESTRYRNLSYALATRSRYHNLQSVHICVVGNYETAPVPDKLVPALAHALVTLKDRYHIEEDKILFHRDVGATLCPGRFINKAKIRSWMKNRALECPANVKSQQEQIINRAGFSIHTIPKWYFLLSGVLTLFVLQVWFLAHYIWTVLARKRKAMQTCIFVTDTQIRG